MTTFASDLKIQDKLHIPNNVTFGVEIEFENASFKNIEQKMDRSKLGGLLSNGWILKQDGSLSKYKDTIGMGGELTSPILHNTVEDYKEIKEALLILLTPDKSALLVGKSSYLNILHMFQEH